MNKEKDKEIKYYYLTDIKHSRNQIYPITNERVWKWYKKHQSTYWVASDIDFKEDRDAFKKLTIDEQFFIKFILAFFAGSDFLVANAICKHDAEIQIMEYKLFNDFKKMMENVHSETYALNIEAISDDENEKEHLRKAILKIPTIKKKLNGIINGQIMGI